MIVLFIHQNFPAQYVHIVRHLAAQPANRVYYITQSALNDVPNVVKILYQSDISQAAACHPTTAGFDAAVRTGLAVADVCRRLRATGVTPDLVVGHSGWGETLFVKDVYPDVPLLSYFEFFYHAVGVDVGFDPEFAPAGEGDRGRLEVRNAVNRMAFASSDWGHTATTWQRSLFPAAMQSRIIAIHEGVDTERIRPNPVAWLSLARKNTVLSAQNQVITYVSRNLEPYRGFHVFMRALPEILRRHPSAQVVIVGGDGLSYGDPPPGGGTYREKMLAEVGDGLDLNRVHFLGQVPYPVFLNVLQISSVHVHLTYPFVLSWSIIEAMACGCLVLGSSTDAVREVLRDGENGLLTDFFAIDQICDRVGEALASPEKMKPLREAARLDAITRYDSTTVTIPRWESLLTDLAAHRMPPEQPPDTGPGTRPGVR